MPLNDYPAAKPTYDFSDTVTAGRTVLANGVLVSVRHHPASKQFPGGSVTWNWHSAAPVASYLVEDSVGKYKLTERTADNGVRFYKAQDQGIKASQRREEPQDHGTAAGHHRVREPVQRALPVHLGRCRGRDAGRELRRGNADHDHLRGRVHRHRCPVPREHAPVVG